jgi:hypothetical protein
VVAVSLPLFVSARTNKRHHHQGTWGPYWGEKDFPSRSGKDLFDVGLLQ